MENNTVKSLSASERKILFIVIFAILATAASLFGIFYYYVHSSMRSLVTERSAAIFSDLIHRIPYQSFMALNKPEDESLELYTDMQELLNTVRQITALRYLYTAKRNEAGTPIYVVDGLAPTAEDFRHIGAPIEDEVLEQLNACLNGSPAYSQSVLYTGWGKIVPACVPITQDKKTVGAIVMEVDVEGLAANMSKALSLSLGGASLLVVLFIFGTSVLLHSLSLPFYRELAYTDLLTGLQNRNAFELEAHKMRLNGTHDGLTVLTCDLNMLKSINDQRGHATGDKYIQAMANLLSERFKDRGRNFRVGGDEFVILLSHVDRTALDAEMAAFHAQARQQDVAGFPLSFAYGLADFDPERDVDVHTTLTRADSRMYAHKRAMKASAEPVTPESGV